MDRSWTAHPSDSSKKTAREHQVWIGMEQRLGRAVMSQHKPRLTHPLPCAVLGSSAQAGNHSMGQGPEEVTEGHELLAPCEELLRAGPAQPGPERSWGGSPHPHHTFEISEPGSFNHSSGGAGPGETEGFSLPQPLDPFSSDTNDSNGN